MLFEQLEGAPPMIPTMILFGLIFGRWWKASTLVAALAWPTLIWATDVISVAAAACQQD